MYATNSMQFFFNNFCLLMESGGTWPSSQPVVLSLMEKRQSKFLRTVLDKTARENLGNGWKVKRWTRFNQLQE